MAITTKQEAQAFLEATCEGEADNLPNAMAPLADVSTALVLVNRMADIEAWGAKRDAALAVQNNPKAPCPINEDQFAEMAPELVLEVFGQPVKTLKKYGNPRKNPRTGELSGGRFSSGAFGYWFGGQVTLVIDGKNVRFQVGGQLVAVNSK